MHYVRAVPAKAEEGLHPVLLVISVTKHHDQDNIQLSTGGSRSFGMVGSIALEQ